MMRMTTNGSTNMLGRDMSIDLGTGVAPKRGMVLPFTALSMSFDEVNYYVDMPAVSYWSFLHLCCYRRHLLRHPFIKILLHLFPVKSEYHKFTFYSGTDVNRSM